MNDVNILLVDDDVRNLDVLESILSSPDYRLVRAANAEKALLALMSEEFAVIMLDIRMPDMSGFELAQLIKQRKKTQMLPIIFLTAYYQEDEHVMQGYGAGAVDYLSKPCNPAILRSKVEVFVDLYRKNRALENEIAERKQTEALLAQRTEELKTSNLELERRNEQLARMASELTLAEQRERKRLAGLLHDHIQQLLVAASFQLHSLPADYVKGEEKPVDNIRNLLAECLKASRSLTVELSPPILHDGGLALALQWLSRGMKEKHGLEIEVEADPQVPNVREDVRILLFQSVRELLFNIVKHAGVANAQVSLQMKPDGDLVITVRDEGVGFDADQLLHAESATAGGFGLFSIRERLTLLAGDFEIASAPGKGVSITLTVPAKCVQATPIPETKSDQRSAAKGAKHAARVNASQENMIRLLLVDDHTIMRQGLAHLLGSQPDIAIVGEGADGVEGVEQARRLEPDCILMDCSMPRMDGIEATRHIHKEHPHIPIIGLSMFEESDRASRMKQAGAVAYVTKSGDPEILLATIRSHAGRAAKPEAAGDVALESV